MQRRGECVPGARDDVREVDGEEGHAGAFTRPAPPAADQRQQL
jgi:hypothetical protein